jgi:hypothetical protein
MEVKGSFPYSRKPSMDLIAVQPGVEPRIRIDTLHGYEVPEYGMIQFLL